MEQGVSWLDAGPSNGSGAAAMRSIMPAALIRWFDGSHHFADLHRLPSPDVALVVLAIAQMGMHLVFFLHITTGPDNTNNVMALAFGVLIVVLLMGGSLWIMANLNHNVMPMDQLIQMQRQIDVGLAGSTLMRGRWTRG
jgi:cytochrome o ubiquinol oxidase subunit IV